MQDVYFLDWSINTGDSVALKQQIGNIETSKAVSDLFAPIAGTMREFNAELLKDPSGINVEGYGKGWLFAMAGDLAPTLDVPVSVEKRALQVSADSAPNQGRFAAAPHQ